MIKAILFDFYGVFMPDTYNLWLETNGLKREGAFAEVVNEFDRGHITKADFLGRLSQEVGREVQSIAAEAGSHGPDVHVIELVRELKSRYKTGLFSNAPKGMRAKLERLNLAPLFDEIIISSEIGYAKPSDESFRIAVATLDVPAEEILFIDDNPRNIEAALKNGIPALHYTSADDITTALKGRQLL